MSPQSGLGLAAFQQIHAAATPMPQAKFKQQMPQPPKRLRSAFIMFSAEKHKKIRAALSEQGIAEKTTKVAKLVSEAWKMLSPDERKIWEDKAAQDKVRYQAEKDMFKGTWKVKRRKDPNAPKRPMSAYLAFSNSRRAIATKENPVATNSEISKILSKMWKEADPVMKQKYVDEEALLREKYKINMAKWKKQAKEIKRNTKKAAAAKAKKDEEESMYGAGAALQIANSGYHETQPDAMSRGLQLLQGLNTDNTSQYGRFFANTGGMANSNNNGNNQASNGFQDSDLAFRFGGNYADNGLGNSGYNTNQSAFNPQPLSDLQGSYRSPLAALLGASERPAPTSTSDQQAQQLLNRLSASSASHQVRHNGNGNDMGSSIDDRLSYNNYQAPTPAAGMRLNDYSRGNGNTELDMRSLFALNGGNGNSNNGNNHGNHHNNNNNPQNAFNLGAGFF